MSRVYVPRMLIQDFVPHPEPYGEAVVVLLNGMFTDVYTDSHGRLFSITNDQDLIRYIKSFKGNNKIIKIRHDEILLSTLSFANIEELRQFDITSTTDKQSVLHLDDESLKLYISHAYSFYSHVFSIKLDKRIHGIIGYHLIDGVAVMNTELFDENLSSNQLHNIISMLQDYITKKYQVMSFDTTYSLG